MKPILTCEIHYFSSPHLYQIYDGFEKLRKARLIDIKIKPVAGQKTKPLLTVIINGSIKVIYDTMDGLNWIDGSIENNLNYFKNNIQADFYFKRSYNQKVNDYSPANCYVYPLGFNYSFMSEDRFSRDMKQKIIDSVRNVKLISKYFSLKTSPLRSKEFEHYPIPNKETKILFLTKVWNPAEFKTNHTKLEVENINKIRMNSIAACKKEFGDRFLGGIEKNKYSMRVAKELTMPLKLTQKRLFIKIIKEFNVCIATTGLHGSSGWKLGEYIAASRAIVSEPLIFDVPGNFQKEVNYLVFNTEGELLNKIHTLLSKRNKLCELMRNNFIYYNNYLRSDILVLNTLLKIFEHI